MTRWLAAAVLVAACGRADDLPKRRLLGLVAEPIVVRDLEPAGLRQKFQDAKNLIRAEKWADAKRLLEQIRAESPHFGNGTVEQYLTRAERELIVSETLIRADGYLTQHQYVDAATELRRIEAHDTIQAEKVGLLRVRLDAVIAGLVASGYMRMAGPKALGPMEELRDIASTLQTLDPASADAPVMAAHAEEALRALEGKPKAKP